MVSSESWKRIHPNSDAHDWMYLTESLKFEIQQTICEAFHNYPFHLRSLWLAPFWWLGLACRAIPYINPNFTTYHVGQRLYSSLFVFCIKVTVYWGKNFPAKTIPYVLCSVCLFHVQKTLVSLLHNRQSTYRKVANSSLSRLVAHFQIFRRFMKGKCDAYVLWPLAKKFQNWIVDWSKDWVV